VPVGDRPDQAFNAFAEREPSFAVLTADQYLRANLTPEREDGFFASGAELVDWLFHVIENRISPHFSPMSMLEYGCGPGRLAVALAARPGSVTAIDRSPAMLGVATREAERRGAGHIGFQTAAELFASQRKFDLICCVHVLQRLSPAEGLALIGRLLERLATGGVAVFHVPFATSAAPAVRAARWLREHVPPANGAINLARGKRWSDPLIPTHIYNMDAVLRKVDQSGAPAAHVVFQHNEDLSNAFVFAEVPLPSITGVDERGRPLPGTALRVRFREEDRPIDVTTLVGETSLEVLNRAAEEYFASLRNWDDHLAKPFGAIVETPRLLVNLSTVLHGLRLRPGDAVLDFGGGTGWLSRALTQLGCRVVLLDVSATALNIATELYRRLPVVGDRPAPEFMPFDGRSIPLPDSSVDRIVSFDALHHAPNPSDMIREFARVLKPGGIAAFSEPGARHSRSPMSQFEMRTYRVVENDIDVHALWRTAQEHGFSDLKLAVFNGPPFYVSLAEFEDFLAEGQTSLRWLTATRVHQRDVRSFFLYKAGAEPPDSRSSDGLAAEISVATGDGLGPVDGRAGRPIGIDVTLTNAGAARWLPSDAPHGGVGLGVHVQDAGGLAVRLKNDVFPLSAAPQGVAPGERIHCRVELPPFEAGTYRVEFDAVAIGVAWFSQVGSKTKVITLEVMK
jgi:ubiquinone/menaquinone biosynthesis C-methylase UbiE